MKRGASKISPLWRWLGWRMVILAMLALLMVGGGMWVRFLLWEQQNRQTIPQYVQQELRVLEANPTANTQRLGEIYGQYLFGNYFSDEVVLTDLLWFGSLMLATVPLIIAGGVWLGWRLSRQIEALANAAGEIAHGRFAARADYFHGAPPALQQLTVDFNHMASQLERYERELQASSAAIAHELRTPLTAAMGRLQGVMDGVFMADAANLGLIRNQLVQLSRLVGDLHLLSLARAGELRLHLGEFLLRLLLEERLAWCSRPPSMRISLKVDSQLRLKADRDRIGQVVSILLDNAMRYAASGKWLSLSATRVGKDVCLLVEDAGPGFSVEHLTRVGERFWRADSSRSRHAGGSGLGLAIARAICEAHQGEIMVENRRGGGACFRITFPQDIA